jgi:TonB family protein
MSNTSSGWADHFARWTIRHAAHRAPPPLAERLEEEWLADLEARPEAWSRLLLGIGCCWAAMVIVQEHLGPGLAAAATTGNKVMSSYAQTDESLLTRRTATLVIIVGLHVALIFAFASGLAHQVFNGLPPTIIGEVFDAPKTPPLPPPQSDPTLHDPQQVVPDPDVPPLDPFFDPATTIHAQPVAVNAEPAGPPTPPPAPPVHRVLGTAGKGFPNSAEYYPPSAIRLGETGTAIVQVCVNSKGYLTGTPTLAQSARSARLDEGALKLARAGSGHYRPTMENGQPVDSCFPLPIKFDLKD